MNQTLSAAHSLVSKDLTHSVHWKDHLIEVLLDKKAKNPAFFPVTSPFAEWFVVVSATSSRHLWALCQATEMECKRMGRRAKSQGRHDDTEWIVLNTQGVFVHLFLEDSRAYYDLETLWKQEESHTFLEPVSDTPFLPRHYNPYTVYFVVKAHGRAMIQLFHQSEDYFFRGISSKCLDLGDGANAYMTGGAELNFIYITRHTNALDKILTQGKQFFDQDNFTFDVIIPQELCTPQMANVLNTMGYPQKSKSVSMVVDLERFAMDQTARFDAEIMIKANDNQLNDWMMPLIGAFESTIEICRVYAGTHENALKRNINLRHFSLYKQEKPIASITLSMHDNTIARIDDVGTLPEFQGKGYASALMRYVLLEAKKLGARHCFLESSDSGLGVYQKLGFETLFKNNIYSRET